MKQFRVFAHGESFDSNCYLASTTLRFDGAWHKRDSVFESNGVFKDLGNGQKMTIFEQERIAIKFLIENREALRGLANYPGVTTFTLGLEYCIDVSDGVVGFCMGPSASLMKIALEIGIELTFYVTIERNLD